MGDRAALDCLMPLVNEELRRLAHRHLAHERAGHTLQTTALVNEAYLRQVDHLQVPFQNRRHFFAITAQLMRRILTDHARKRGYAKRDGDARHIARDEAVAFSPERAADLIDLDDTLDNWRAIDPQERRAVELRNFSGLPIEKTAQTLDLSVDKVNREWSTVNCSSTKR